MRPIAHPAERLRQRGEAPRSPGLAQGFFHRLRIECKILGEQKPDPRGHIAEVFHLRLHDRERAHERFFSAVGHAGLVHERLRQLRETREPHGEDVLAVQPKTFVEVENRIPAVDFFEVEEREDFRDIEPFAVVAGRPAEQAQVIRHSLGRVALVEEIGDARAAVAFAELFPLMVQDERDVGELRRHGPERLVELDVFRRVREVVLAADHMRELHLDVVHHIHEMENPRAVRAADRHVGVRGRVRHVELDPPANQVLHHHRLPRGTEPDRAAILVGVPARLELREVFGINIAPLALAVGAVGAALVGTLVPVEPEPIQAVENDLVRLGGVAFFVGVLDAQDELPAVAAGVEPVEKGRAGAAHMQVAGRRRRESGANFHRWRQRHPARENKTLKSPHSAPVFSG